MKFGKIRKDGSVICTIDENDEVLNSDDFILRVLEDIIDSIPESKNMVNSDLADKTITIPGNLFAKIQTVGLLLCLKNKIESETVCKEEEILSFAKAKALVRNCGINNTQKYIALRTAKKLPQGLPVDPKTSYAKYWKGWTDFCGTRPK